MAGEAATPTSYIQHHLQNLVYPVRDGGGTFWTIHVDTLVMAVLMGLVMVFAFWMATRNATAGVPASGRRLLRSAWNLSIARPRTPITAAASW